MKSKSIKFRKKYIIGLILFFVIFISFGQKVVAAQETLIILTNKTFTALEPGGPTIFDNILIEQNSDWNNFQQSDNNEMRSAGVIFHETSLGSEWGTGVNPAVILVTYGIEKNWELPVNGDLVSEVDRIRSLLFQYRSEWIHGQVDQGQYPMIDDTVVLKAVDSSPANETQYRARFYFDPNSLTMSNNSAHFILDGYNTFYNAIPFRLELLYESGTYKLRPRVMKDDWGYTNGSKYTISNDWHMIEIDWKQSTGAGANNGYLSLWIDGVLVGTIANVDNDAVHNHLDEIRLGATAGIDSTTSGSMFFDKFVSRRFTYIGQ